jgi:hypothetical protein
MALLRSNLGLGEGPATNCLNHGSAQLCYKFVPAVMYGFESEIILSVVKMAVLKSTGLLDKHFRGEAYKFRKKLERKKLHIVFNRMM